MSGFAGNKLALTIEYDGTRFRGSQRQGKGITIQAELETALEKLTGEKVRIHLASRTDAGVSAMGQVVSFWSGATMPLERMASGLNHYLPDDVAVKEVCLIPEDLDIRRKAISREYCYRIWNSSTPSPLMERHGYRVSGELDVEMMNQAAQMLVGTKDMVSFASRLGKMEKNTVRTVHEAEVYQQGKEIIFRIKARSFLRHQVRNTVGSLIKIGRGAMSLNGFNALIETGKPGSAGPAVPGRGLCLVNIKYPRDLGDYNENL